MVQGVPATRSRHWARALFGLLLLYFLALGVAKPLLRPYAYSDFVTFYSASRVFAAGLSPYDMATLRTAEVPEYSGWVGRYLYPPPFAAVVLRPFLLLPFPLARALWGGIECIAYLVACLVLTGWLRGSLRRQAWMLPALLFLPFAPFHYDLKMGSVSGVLLLCCGVFLLARSRRRENLAALALAAAILLKLTPALLLLFLLVRREHGLWIRTVLAMGLFIGLCSPWTGWSVYGEYALRVLPGLARDNYSWFANQSIDAFFWRLFVPNPDTTPWLDAPWLYALLTAVASLSVLLLLFRALWAERRRPPTGDVSPALALLASVMLARVAWEAMVVLALPCFLSALQAFQRGQLGRHAAAGLGLAFALCALPIPYAQYPIRSGAGLLLMAPRLAGMLLAFVIVVQLASRQAAGEISAEESSVS